MRDDTEVNYLISIGFYKVNDDYKILKDQIYEVSAIDSNNSVDFIKVKQFYDGLYLIEYDFDNYSNLSYGKVKDLLPISILNEFDILKNKSDVINLCEKLNVEYQSNYYSDTIDIGIPIKIREVNVSEGYKKNDLVVLANFRISFEYDDNDNINYSNLWFDMHNNINIIMSEEAFQSIPKLSGFGNIDSNINYNDNATCINQSNQGTIITDNINSNVCNSYHPYGSSSYDVVSYFVDQKGDVKLEIENTVNGVNEFVAKDNKELEYKITVKNTGDATSGNNIIETTVADEVIVKEETISDAGNYDKEDKTITWRIDSLDSNEEYSVYYNVTLLPNADKNKTYIGKSKVSSNQSDVVHSRETKVFLTKSAEVIDGNNLVNPNTYNTAIFGFSFILVMLVISTYIVKKKVNNN